MPLTVGGGVRTVEDIRKLLLAGADKVSINTAAVNNPDFVREASEKFGNQCIVVAIDAKKVSVDGEPAAWEIFTHGGRTATGIDAIAFAKQVANLGAGELLVTSMDRDGTKGGYDLALVRAIAAISITSSTVSKRAMPARYSQPRSSTLARIRFPKRRATWLRLG